MIAMMIKQKVNVIDKVTKKASEITLWDSYSSSAQFRSDVMYVNDESFNQLTKDVRAFFSNK